jgi:hypothetical protein
MATKLDGFITQGPHRAGCVSYPRLGLGLMQWSHFDFMTRDRLNEIRATLTSVDNVFEPLESFARDVLDLLSAAETLVTANERKRQIGTLKGFGAQLDGRWELVSHQPYECGKILVCLKGPYV